MPGLLEVLAPGARGLDVVEVVHDLPVVEARVADVQLAAARAPPGALRRRRSQLMAETVASQRSASLRTRRELVVSATANDGRCQVKAFVTGGTGFIGSRVVRRLRERGDEVVALVRSPEKAADLRELGCELVEGDLSSEQAIRDGVQGCDAVFHVAAVYKVGIPASERDAMCDANVRGTERVLDAAIEAGVPRIVYVSTVGVFGNTHGQVVDETYSRDGEDFLSCYEETKCRSHQVALDRIAKGAPIVIVQPGGVYGPGDHSELGNIIDQAADRQAEDADVPRDRLQPRARRRRRGRHRARARQGRGGRVVRARRRDLEDARR